MTQIRQKILDFDVRPAIGGQDYLVAISNREAVEWLDLWPDWQVPAIIIYGSTGCGKSHLANLFSLKCGASIIKPSLIEDIGISNILEESNFCVLDDTEFGFNEEDLLHLYNALVSSGGHMLMTAKIPPGQWGLTLKDLESRLKAIPTIKIGLPDDGLLEAVFAKHFSDRQLLVSAEIISYLIPRIERSLSMVQKVVEKIDKLSLSSGRKVTLPLVREVLSSNFDK